MLGAKTARHVELSFARDVSEMPIAMVDARRVAQERDALIAYIAPRIFSEAINPERELSLSA